MSLLFVDSSALAKRYLTEMGSTWVTRLADPLAKNSVIVAAITRVEVAAALAARCRAGAITTIERDNLVALLLRHFDAEYRIAAIDAAMISRAVTLTQRYRLRGYDAVQLAAALTVSDLLPGLLFIAADDDLLNAARAEGLAGENPNQHL